MKLVKQLYKTFAVILGLAFLPLQAEIIETSTSAAILPYVEEDALVFFNIANVLTDSSLSLGNAASRKYLKKNCDAATHDSLTWLIFNEVPHQAVERATPALIESLQSAGVAVAALTSRGRAVWYDTEMPGVDHMTEQVLYQIGIDLRLSQLPFVSIQMEGAPFFEHYHAGIFYVEHMDKGEFLKNLFTQTGHIPSKVILVDDKRDGLESVEAAMQKSGIPFYGFLYTRATLEAPKFNPMAAILQLEQLLEKGTILEEKQAQELAETLYKEVDPDLYFREVLNKYYKK